MDVLLEIGRLRARRFLRSLGSSGFLLVARARRDVRGPRDRRIQGPRWCEWFLLSFRERRLWKRRIDSRISRWRSGFDPFLRDGPNLGGRSLALSFHRIRQWVGIRRRKGESASLNQASEIAVHRESSRSIRARYLSRRHGATAKISASLQ